MHAANPALDPATNATVSASAGSGKTWMLVSRIVRLLLAGARPGGILALTFTRKAAAEMQQRLGQRLFQLATADDASLDGLLAEIGLPAQDMLRQRARSLYAQHLYDDFPLRTQTFHAFCQDLLARFPLEADVPPGFSLLDNETLLQTQARDALFNLAALDMGSAMAQSLQALMRECGSYEALKKSLQAFISQRSDWWAYTRDEADPAAFASAQLAQRFDITPGSRPLLDFFSPGYLQKLDSFMSLLALHPTKTNLGTIEKLRATLSEPLTTDSFSGVALCFLTQKGEPRSAHNESETLRKKLGAHTGPFLALVTELVDAIQTAQDRHLRLQTWELNRLWYQCGSAYLQQYQILKHNQRLLDFADLEWKTWQLLQHSDNAHWVQYKLDQRIDHLLVDEFQDTNPTQWQLLLPLLQEMAAGDAERQRSVFLVGDEKQSIYGFRRAKPELQSIAALWLDHNLNARAFPLNKSWRSSPAIIRFVNALFSRPEIQALIPDFPEHETHKANMPGEVVIFPLYEDDTPEETPPEQTVLRNPLEQPRAEKENPHDREARDIALKIRELIDSGMAVQAEGEQRALGYDDIYILLRKRTHVSCYEKALRAAGIPYIGANRGSLLDCIEIDDMLALLDVLLTPYNNLALAQVLKSPLFNAGDEDLMRLARHKADVLWIDKLAAIATQADAPACIQRAHQDLQTWSALVDRIPVHDLLDRIYHQSQLLERYIACSPPSLQPRVRANLIRFLEMALELDSGRYPSLMHFLGHIRELQQQERDAPDEAPMQTEDARVKIMTIHASKGLEAPVVFLVDTINADIARDSLSPLVDWPAQASRPQHMQLIPSSENRDRISRDYLEAQQRQVDKEQINLLYVAVTRARQCLYISACKPGKRADTDWYTPMLQALDQLHPDALWPKTFRVGEFHTAPTGAHHTHAISAVSLPPARFTDSLNMMPRIAPSLASDNSDASGDEDGQLRGQLIHRALDLLTRSPAWSLQQTRSTLCEEFMLAEQDSLLEACLDEAMAVVHDPALASIFAPASGTRMLNECPISYTGNAGRVQGVVDRLLVSEQDIVIVDYKTHRVDAADLTRLAEQYRPQMRYYHEGICQAWPHHRTQVQILFTFHRQIITLDFTHPPTRIT